MSTPLTSPTPENVAEMLTSGDNDYHDGNDWWPSIGATGNVVELEIEPVDEDGDCMPKVHFRAIVVEATPEIPQEVAAHVLFHLGRPGGWPASQFIQHLLRAFEVADVVNRARLGAGFPAYLAAFELYRSSDTGVAQLQEIAEKDGAL